MARGYIRPEVPESLYRQMIGGRRIMINPSQADILQALDDVQHRSRSRRLSHGVVRAAWHEFQVRNLPGVSRAAATEAPAHYRWPLRATVFQAVAITAKLDGVIVERAAIPPGSELEWPVPDAGADPDDEAAQHGHTLARRNAIVTAFWLHLSDAEITALGEHMEAVGSS